MNKAFVILILTASLLVGACTQQTATKPDSGKIRIGFLMDTLKEERWQRDRDLFVNRANELGAEVIVQSADGKDETQIKQAESLLLQGVNVLVVIPHNSEISSTIVDKERMCRCRLSMSRWKCFITDLMRGESFVRGKYEP